MYYDIKNSYSQKYVNLNIFPSLAYFFNISISGNDDQVIQSVSIESNKTLSYLNKNYFM